MSSLMTEGFRMSSTGTTSKDMNASDNVPEECEEENRCKASLLVHYITKEYELLKLVLGHLPIKDLNSAAQVCRTWASAADVIKRSRIEPHWLLWHQLRNGHRMEELPARLFANYIYSEPQLCLCFMTRVANRTNIDCMRSKAPCPCGHRKKCKLTHRVVHYIRAQLMPGCPCVLVEGCGVVGTAHDLSHTMELEQKSNGYSCLLLPKVPGTVVTFFQFDKVACLRLLYATKELKNSRKAREGDKQSIRDCVNLKEIENLTGVPPSSQPIRCLLLFSREGQTQLINNLVTCLQSRQEEKIAVGGGLFNTISLGNIQSELYKRRMVCVVGIALSGENVTAASTILGSHVVDVVQVDEAMEELQACNLPAKNSVAFMFACMGRGSKWYNEHNVESASFRRHFPSTPLMGYFGNGEIGLKYLPVPQDGDSEYERPLKRAREESCSLLHSYTTVIVYVALGSKHAS